MLSTLFDEPQRVAGAVLKVSRSTVVRDLG